MTSPNTTISLWVKSFISDLDILMCKYLIRIAWINERVNKLHQGYWGIHDMFICHTYIYIYVAAYIQNLFWQKQYRNIYNVFLAAKKPRKNRKHRIQIRHTNKKQFGPGESSHDPPSPHLKTAALRPPPGSAQSCMCSRCLVSFWPYQAMTLTSVRILWQSSPCKLKFKNSSIYLVCYRHRSTIYIYTYIYIYVYMGIKYPRTKNLWRVISTCEDLAHSQAWQVCGKLRCWFMEDSGSNPERLLLSSHLRMESSITIFTILTHVSTTLVCHFDQKKLCTIYMGKPWLTKQLIENY